jgi:signal transduction histidine kinase
MGSEAKAIDTVARETRDAKRLLVARSALRAVPFNIINAVLLSILFIGYVQPLAHAAWFVLICGGALMRLAAMWRARRADRVPTTNELTAYTILSACVGAGWGLTPFLLPPDVPVIVTQAVALVIAGMAAGAAMTSASERRVVLAYTLPALGLWALSIGLTGGWQSAVVVVLLIGFFFAMNTLTRTYAGTLNDAVHASAELNEARKHTEAQAAAMSRLAEQNDGAARRAEEQARANAAVLANMSHELRTPLNGMLGMTQLLQESGLSQDQARLALRARESAETLNSLLTDVLDVARIEAGRLDLEIGDVTARALARSAERTFGPDAEAKGLAFEVQVSGDSERALRADESRLKQLTQVFVGNAVRFTPSGGVTVSFTTKDEDGDRASLRVEVRDTGDGVPESARPNLFDALAADRMDANIRESGAGLGLHLAKRLAALMDGEVGYAPAETGSGSQFWFEVRLKASQKCDKYADGEQMTFDARRLRILVGEDNAARRSVLLGYLNSFNCEVTCAGSGHEMTEALSTAAYDAVVLGLSLEDCEPEDAAADVRSLPSTAAMTPIVRLDAHIDEAVITGGMETLIRAPVTADSVLTALRAALEFDPAAVANLRRIA